MDLVVARSAHHSSVALPSLASHPLRPLLAPADERSVQVGMGGPNPAGYGGPSHNPGYQVPTTLHPFSSSMTRTLRLSSRSDDSLFKLSDAVAHSATHVCLLSRGVMPLAAAPPICSSRRPSEHCTRRPTRRLGAHTIRHCTRQRQRSDEISQSAVIRVLTERLLALHCHTPHEEDCTIGTALTAN